MDATMVLSLATLAISLTALVVSIRLTLWQIRLASGGNHLPVVLEAFKESRSTAWFEAQKYVLTKLAEEHAADCGIHGLPVSACTYTKIIGLFFDDLGKLVGHGVIDQNLVIGAYGTPIVRLWDALAPYVYAERQIHKLHFWVYFEDLAARTASTPPEVVYAHIRLRPRPPRPEPDTKKPDPTAPPPTPSTP